jgi:PAS domain S-box-containing protein
MRGEPIYSDYEHVSVLRDKIKESEGLSAFAVLPIFNDGLVIGCLNMASRTTRRVNARSRLALETIAAQIGSTVARLKTEKLLRASEKRYRLLFENTSIHVSFWSVDDWRLLSVNHRGAGQIGRKPEDVVGKTIEEVFHFDPEVAEKFRLTLEQILASKKGHQSVDCVKMPDGSQRWFRTDIQPVTDEEGRTIAVQTISEDITEARKAEQSLQKERDKAQKYLDVAGAIFVLIDTNERVTLVNKKGCAALGYEEEDIVGKKWFDTFVPQEHRKRVKEGFHRLMAGEVEPVEYFENPVLTKDGQQRLIAWHNAVLRDSVGNITGTLSSGEDITERKRAEEALRQSEENYRKLFDGIPVGVYKTTPDGRILMANPALVRMLGHKSFEDLSRRDLEKTGFDIGNPRSAFKERIEAEGRLVGYESAWIRADGSLVHVSESARAVRDDSGSIVFYEGIVEDITEQKKTEKALYEAKLRQIEAVRAANVGLWDWDLAANRVFYSAEWKKQIGYCEEEIGDDFKEWSSRVHPDDLEAALERVQNCVDEKCTDYRTEFRFRHKDGSYRWIQARGSALNDQAGRPIRMLGSHIDITEYKEAQQALQLERDMAQKYLDVAGVMMMVIGTDRKVQLMNQKGCQILGYDEDEIVGKDWFENFLPERVRQQVGAVEQKLRAGKANEVEYFENPVLTKSGQERVIAWHNTVLRDRDGRPIAGLSSGEDITDRKKMEESLRQSEQRFRTIFELSPHSTVLTDLEGNIIACNQKFCELHATTKGPPAQVGRNVREFLPEEERARLSCSIENKLATKSRSAPVEYTMLREDGTEFLAETTSSVVTDSEGRPCALLATAYDVTERKLSDQRLRQSEERFKILFELAPDAYYIHDLEGNFIDANKAAEQLVGYSIEEATDRNFLDLGLVWKEDIPRVRESLADNKAGKLAGPLELTVQRKDGEKVFVEIRSYPVEIGGRNLVLGIARDITERKRLEEAYRSLVDNSIQGLAIIQDGKFVFLNRAFSSTTGYTEQELLSASPEEMRSMVHPEDRELVLTRHKERLEGNSVPARYEFRFVRKDGGTAWAEIHASEIEYRGRPAIQAAYIDITDRKAAEQAVRQSEERLKVLFESAPDPIYVLDLEGNFVDGNKAAEKLAGYSRDELIGKNFIQTGLLSSEQMLKAVANLKRIAMEKPTGPDEYIITRKDGTGIPVEIRAFPVKIEEQVFSLAVARDISSRKATERKLIEYQTQLKSLASELSLTEERERHRLATDLHDQISQTLVFSRIKLQQLHASVCSDEIAQPIEEVCNSLDGIIQDTRTLTFDLSSPILYELGFEAAVSEWLDEQVGRKHGIKTSFEDDGLPKPLEEDIRVLLFRNVRELLINIVKHAHAKNVKVCISRIRWEICICIQDDGVGFDPAEVDCKSGFGIFSIRERLEHLAGHIEVESEPGRGTKITMTAPLKAD